MPNGPQEVLGDLTPRLEAAARAVADAQDHLRKEQARRNALIVQAVDEGMNHGAVARASGVSRTRVLGLLVESQPGQLLP